MPPITSPQLREAYSSKIEWARKLIHKLKKEKREMIKYEVSKSNLKIITPISLEEYLL